MKRRPAAFGLIYRYGGRHIGKDSYQAAQKIYNTQNLHCSLMVDGLLKAWQEESKKQTSSNFTFPDYYILVDVEKACKTAAGAAGPVVRELHSGLQIWRFDITLAKQNATFLLRFLDPNLSQVVEVHRLLSDTSERNLVNEIRRRHGASDDNACEQPGKYELLSDAYRLWGYNKLPQLRRGGFEAGGLLTEWKKYEGLYCNSDDKHILLHAIGVCSDVAKRTARDAPNPDMEVVDANRHIVRFKARLARKDVTFYLRFNEKEHRKVIDVQRYEPSMAGTPIPGSSGDVFPLSEKELLEKMA